MLWVSQTKQENNGWEEKSPNACTSDCSEKSAKSLRLVKECIFLEKESITYVFGQPYPQGILPSDTVPFLSPSKTTACSGDEVGVWSISCKCFNLYSNILVLTQP